ncbi:hypothetical protein HRbin08_00032 [bacterium HR08]|nr:hypothetical protein HRbin08_00032 [bacterium HR08]
MNSWKIIIPAFIALAICCLGPRLIALIGAGLLWLAAPLGEFGWLIVPGAILLLALAWRERRSRRACCRVKSSNPDEP